MTVQSGAFDSQMVRIKGSVNNPKCVTQAAFFVQDRAKRLVPTETGDLKNSIFINTEQTADGVLSEVYTPPGGYALYVELGTGRRGADNHAGISPNVTPAYTMDPWWFHESQIDKDAAEKYGWFYIDTEQGRFYRCEGQPAQPFLYPALADNRQRVLEILKRGFNKAIGESK